MAGTHREGMPDMSGGGGHCAGKPSSYPRRAIKVISNNQFIFNWQDCGHRMPKDMEFRISAGSRCRIRTEYELFGTQLEPLCFGGIRNHQYLRMC
jgi:hypothetical protein